MDDDKGVKSKFSSCTVSRMGSSVLEEVLPLSSSVASSTIGSDGKESLVKVGDEVGFIYLGCNSSAEVIFGDSHLEEDCFSRIERRCCLK